MLRNPEPSAPTRTVGSLEELCINTIRMLSVDAVEKANSGHPGMPMESAPLAYVLWTKVLRYNPKNPAWPDRDRFVLSAGHGSMLLYSMLHLTGYDLPLEELQRFRQWGSKTPGHPERHDAPGVEMTTGPLGQGVSTAVGIAAAEAHLAARFNRPGHTIVNHYTYVFASDGDIMEGISSETASLAGHWGLHKLIVVYLDNKVTLAGEAAISLSEDVQKRYEAYGWHVLRVEGNDLAGIEEAFRAAKAQTAKPVLIIARTHLGYGSPNKHDSCEAHGNPLGPEETKLTKQNLGWPLEPTFLLPEEALAVFRQAVERGAQAERQWREQFAAYAKANPELAATWTQALAGELPAGWDQGLPVFKEGEEPQATRKSGGKVLSALAKKIPWIVGGSADLDPSTLTYLAGEGDFLRGSYAGRNVHYGVRENAMGAIANGMAVHGGLLPYTATFFCFADYMRSTMRLAAIMKLHTIYVFTHDSIGLGEDGPTHQPIEHLASLRAMPGMVLLRPGDAAEALEAWKFAVSYREGPVTLVLTRQNLPLMTSQKAPQGVARGGYVLLDPPAGAPELILMATGSEVSLVVEAHKQLTAAGIRARVVSLPSWELFERQPQTYKDQVLPPSVTARVAVETGSPFGWERHVGCKGAIIGLNRFGASAPAKIVLKELGFSVENVVAKARAVLEQSRRA